MQAICLCIMHVELSFEEEAMRDLGWKTDSERKVLTTPIFGISEMERTSHDGRHGKFVRMDSPDWVVAIPWFRRSDGVPCFVMEEQWRHGPGRITREFPAGLVEKGESGEEAAKRELMEETGMTGRFTLLGAVCPNPAFMDNVQSFFLVEDLKKEGIQSLDPNEEIDIVEVPVEDAIRDMGEGIYDNGIMMGAIGFFLRYAEKHPQLRTLTV